MNKPKTPSTIGFVGAGKMALALAGGMVDGQVIEPHKVWFFDPAQDSIGAFQKRIPKAQLGTDNRQVAENSDCLILAVKPQIMPQVLKQLKGYAAQALVISVAAGIKLASIVRTLETENAIRVMPNTPCLIGEGAIGITSTDRVNPETLDFAKKMFSAVGRVVQVNERQLDAVTGLSGSGPAYIFTMIEALADGGVMMGLRREDALLLATQTVIGAGRLVMESGLHPAELRDQVTSPGGTTIAGLRALESGSFRASVIAAVEAAAHRAGELAG